MPSKLSVKATESVHSSLQMEEKGWFMFQGTSAPPAPSTWAVGPRPGIPVLMRKTGPRAAVCKAREASPDLKPPVRGPSGRPAGTGTGGCWRKSATHKDYIYKAERLALRPGEGTRLSGDGDEQDAGVAPRGVKLSGSSLCARESHGELRRWEHEAAGGVHGKPSGGALSSGKNTELYQQERPAPQTPGLRDTRRRAPRTETQLHWGAGGGKPHKEQAPGRRKCPK